MQDFEGWEPVYLSEEADKIDWRYHMCVSLRYNYDYCISIQQVFISCLAEIIRSKITKFAPKSKCAE